LIYYSAFLGESFMNVGWFFKRQILFQRLEVNMSQLMDLLRGPALGVISMIILMAGVLIITAFAALIAQMSLLFRLKPWNTSENRSETGKEGYPQESYEQRSSARENQRASSQSRQRSPQVVVVEPNANEVIDAVWWETVKQ
jgi:predicted lipid-binding transport protein (Tim44 family)